MLLDMVTKLQDELAELKSRQQSAAPTPSPSVAPSAFVTPSPRRASAASGDLRTSSAPKESKAMSPNNDPGIVSQLPTKVSPVVKPTKAEVAAGHPAPSGEPSTTGDAKPGGHEAGLLKQTAHELFT